MTRRQSVTKALTEYFTKEVEAIPRLPPPFVLKDPDRRPAPGNSALLTIGTTVARLAVAAAIALPFTGLGSNSPSAREFADIQAELDTGQVVENRLRLLTTLVMTHLGGEGNE